MPTTTKLLLTMFSCATLLVHLTLHGQSNERLSLRTYRLAATPTVNIGDDRDPQHEFLRIDGVWRMPSGEIVVVNAGSSEIRVFGALGAFRKSFGRAGDGPGEFRNIGWSFHRGDTVFIYDGNLRRITTVLLNGTPRLLGTTPLLIKDERGPSVIGRLSDGRWLVRAQSDPNVNLRGVQRLTGFAGVINADANGEIAWKAETADLPIIVYSPDANGKMVSIIERAFPAGFTAMSAGSTIWVGDGATDSLQRVDLTTGRKTTIRIPATPVPITKDVVDAAIAQELEGVRNQNARASIDFKYRRENLPKTLPVYHRFLFGSNGEMWIELDSRSSGSPNQYIVLSASGVAVARVSTQAGFRVTDIGADYVVGVFKDVDGVESVRQYMLTR